MVKNILTVLLIVFQISVFGQDLTQQLDNYLVSTAKRKNKFNGTVLVTKNGKILLNRGHGYKNKVEQVYNDTSTIYQIGSITKTFTSAIVLRLQEENLLSLTDNITKYIPEYPNGGDITIENLFDPYTRDFRLFTIKEVC
jgi:CubicO group peptidase (beta-lactamase class C family)